MKSIDIFLTAVANTFRSKLRTTLTVLAIFIGAFTLTITSGLGTGINAYINSTVSSIGAAGVLTVTKSQPDANTTSGPQKYDANQVTSTNRGPASSVTALTPTDITKIKRISGVGSVTPSVALKPDYIAYGSGTKYNISIASATPGATLQLAAGRQPNASSAQLQIVIPASYVKPLGLSTRSKALGSRVTVAITDANHKQTMVPATVVGISEAGLLTGTDVATSNAALTSKLYEAQQVGVPAATRDLYAQATVRISAPASSSDTTALKNRLTKAGYTGATVQDQIGTFTTVINAIVLVLDAFAVIALLAAGFGIVNTLLMSVQERTREIGLMKAMGMGSARVFALFSTEAIVIGFLGSAIGAGIGMLAGSAVSSALASSLFSGLPGLKIIAFNPISIATIIVVIMAIAFLAGTLPATRAARADPIESLRYE